MASRGPVWNRPLRKKPTSLFICRRGGCPHPPDRFQASGGRSDPRGRPCRMRNQISLPFVGAAHRAARAFPLQGGRCRAYARRMRVTFLPESSTAGASRGPPAQTRKVSLKPVGEGLKVNRPKAERSHPGVCPSRGPASVRPLRKKRTRLFICRRGGCPHPPARVSNMLS